MKRHSGSCATKATFLVVISATLMMTTSLAFAQPGPGAGRCGPGASASGPTADCPAGRGMRSGARSGKDYTPGWGMMSRAEQQEHREKMRSFKNYDECKAYTDQHHGQMEARAREEGLALPAQPRPTRAPA